MVFCGSFLMNEEEEYCIPVEVSNATLAEPVAKKGTQWVGIDTMCSHSITPDPRLVGTLKSSLSFRVRGWAEGDMQVKEHGISPWLGLLIFTPKATATLLSYYELLAHFWATWSKDGRRVTFVSMRDPSLELRAELDSSENSRLLLCDLSPLLSRLENAVVAAESDVAIRMVSREYSAVCEAIRFHRIHHQSVKRMMVGVRVGNLKDYPFTEHTLSLIELVQGGPCLCCVAAGLTRRSTKMRRPKPRARSEEDKLPVLTTDEQRLLVATTRHETLLVDLMFWFKEPYLVTRGLKYGEPTTVALSSKSADAVAHALELVILDYKRARIRVAGLIDIDDYYEREEYLSKWDIATIRSDNEPSIVRLGLMLVKKYSIDAVQVPAGEHVHGVERTIRTLKMHADACYAALPYNLPEKARPYLIGHVTFWESLYPNGEKVLCPWSRHNTLRLLYTDVTRAGFGESVIAYRPVVTLDVGVPRGEEGICLGANPRAPGSIFFYSLETHMVKSRARYTLFRGRDLVSILGENRYHVKPGELKPNTKLMEAATESRDNDQLMTFPEYSDDEIYSSDEEAEPVPEPPNTPAVPSVPHQAATPGPTPGKSAAEVEDADVAELEPRQLAQAFEEVEDLERQASLVPEPTGVVEARDPLRDLIPVRRSTRVKKTPSKYDQMTWAKHVCAERQVTPGRTTSFLLEEAYDALDSGELYVDANSVNWEKARELVGIDRAEEAHNVECDNMLRHEVFRPTSKSLDDVGMYFNSLDLFDIKLNGKDKSRLVVTKPASKWKGSTVDFGIDEAAPTIDIKIVMLMLSLCLQFNLELEVWDVKGAFLFAKMVKNGIFVLLRPKVATRMVARAKLKGLNWEQYQRPDGSLIVEVLKAWYGTTAAPALWNREIDSTLRTLCGYTPHPLCCCLYMRWIGDIPSFILLHVDDMGAMFRAGSPERVRVLRILEKKYGTLAKQIGDKVTYIGITVRRDRKLNCFGLSQKPLIEKMAATHGVTGHELVPNDSEFMTEDFDSGTVKVAEYRSLVMSLRYVASLTKPHVLFHTTFLATCQSHPTGKRWADGVRLLRYFLSTAEEELYIRPCGWRPQIRVHADASANLYPDGLGHSGISVFVGNAGASVFNKSKKQSIYTESSTDAEIVCATTATMIGDFYLCFLDHLGFPGKEVLYLQDNSSSMHLMMEGCKDHAEKRKFIVNRINCIKQYLMNSDNRARMEHFGTKYIAADTLSKALVGILRDRGKEKLLGWRHDMETMSTEEMEAVKAERARKTRDDALRAASSGKAKRKY